MTRLSVWLPFRRSLRAQLTLLAVLVVVSTNLLLVGGLVAVFWWDAKRTAQAEAESLGQLATTAVVGPLLEANYAELNDMARDAVALRQIGYFRINRPDGTRLAEAGVLRTDAWAPHVHRQPVVFGRQTLGELELQMARAPWEGALAGWILAGCAALVLSVGLGYLLFSGFVRVLQRRLEALQRATEAFAAGQTDARASLEGEDELAKFGRAFDVAMQHIAQHQARLRETAAAAEAASVAKSRFLATMSHEIRTPLNGILGMAQLMLMGRLSEEDQRKYARTILRSGQTLLALLNDVLDLSKIEAGRFQLHESRFSPQAWLAECAELMAASAADKGLAWTVQWKGEDRAVLGDAHRLRQMLSNLMGNAIKFTERGAVHTVGELLPLAEGDGSRVLLRCCVTDSGIGIDARQQDRLFKPFSQLDASDTRKFGGSGLGLSIVRSLAEQMGGRVGVESELGKGSCFWFEVPVRLAGPGEAAGAEAARPAPAKAPALREEPQPRAAPAAVWSPSQPPAVWPNTQPPAAAEPQPEGSAGCVLLVEDNLTNRLVVEKILQKAGYTVLNAENGQLAVQVYHAERQRIQLVLMDVQMPVMDGLQATREIRQIEAREGWPRMPVVGLTANAYAEDRDACLAAGMDDFLTKPVNVGQLLQTVKRRGRAAARSAAPEGVG